MVVQALPKGERGELAVEVLTEVGTDVIVPWAAERCVAVWRGEKAVRGRRRWVDTAHAAAKQARRARFPVVEELATTVDVAARVASASLALVLHEDATDPIGDVALPAEGDVLLVVGPEGGISASEREELSAARRVGIIDFHTGLGPFGHGELICAVAPDAKSFARSRAWYGDEMTSPESGTSTSAVVVGVMTDCFPQELPDAEVTSIAIEYGTYTVPEVLTAVRADNWLHQRGDLASPLGKTIKADIKERFFPSGDKWREMVWARADQTIGWALEGLGG